MIATISNNKNNNNHHRLSFATPPSTLHPVLVKVAAVVMVMVPCIVSVPTSLCIPRRPCSSKVTSFIRRKKREPLQRKIPTPSEGGVGVVCSLVVVAVVKKEDARKEDGVL